MSSRGELTIAIVRLMMLRMMKNSEAQKRSYEDKRKPEFSLMREITKEEVHKQD